MTAANPDARSPICLTSPCSLLSSLSATTTISSSSSPAHMDFGPASAHQPAHSLYATDLDHNFSSLPAVDTASPSHHPLSQSIPPQNFDHAEPMDVPDHPPYDMFHNNPSSFSTRYRTNSSSSSLGPSYSMPQDAAYSRPAFSDPVPPFAHSNSSSYDMMSSVPSSYSGSSGKVSPLTPSDPMTGIQHSSVFPLNGHQKAYSDSHYPDIHPERRISNVNGSSYHSDFPDDYGMSNGPGYPPSALQPFQDRMGRFPSDSHFPHSSLPPSSVTSHMGHSPDMFRTGVAPHATHGFRPDSGIPAYDDIPQYLGPNPHADLPLIPSMGGFPGLRHGPGMGSSNDLQTFIR